MNRIEEAKAIFRSGFNCSQAVLSSLFEDIGIDKELALKIASGFGAGTGRLQNTCGAVVGAFMYECSGLYDHKQRFAIMRNWKKNKSMNKRSLEQ